MSKKKQPEPEPEVVIEDQDEEEPEPIPEPEPEPPKAAQPAEPGFDLEKFASGIGRGVAASLRDLGVLEQKPSEKAEPKQEQHGESGAGAGERPEPVRANWAERFLGVDPNRKPRQS